MFKKFETSIEKQQTKQKVLNLKQIPTIDMDEHIDQFEELMELSKKDDAEDDKCFSLNLPEDYKSNLTNNF